MTESSDLRPKWKSCAKRKLLNLLERSRKEHRRSGIEGSSYLKITDDKLFNRYLSFL